MVQVLHLEFGLSVRERLAITCDIRSRVAEAVEEAATAAVRERLRGGMIDLSKKFGMDYPRPRAHDTPARATARVASHATTTTRGSYI